MFIGAVFKETPRRLKMPEESFHLDFGPVFRIEERVLHCTKAGDITGESKAYHVGKVTTYMYKLICTVANDYLASGMRKEDVLVIPEEDVEQAIIWRRRRIEKIVAFGNEHCKKLTRDN